MKKSLFYRFLPTLFLVITVNAVSPTHIKGQEIYDTKLGINFFGLTPNFMKPAGLDEDGYDFNVCPIALYKIVGGRTGFRSIFFINLGERPERINRNIVFSSFGIEVAFPIFFNKRISEYNVLEGFYIGPTVRGLMIFEEYKNRPLMNIGFFAEPGYSMVFFDNYAFKVGLLLGRKLLLHDGSTSFFKSEWQNHIGIKFVVGSWI